MTKNRAHIPDLNRRRLLRNSSLALSASMMPGLGLDALAQSTGPADLIVVDANIFTQDPIQPRASAIAVRNGLVQAVGSESELAGYRGASTRVLSAGGRTLLPGLNDSHMHPTRAGRFYALELRWDGLDSLEQGLNMIREAAASTPDGQWVRVIGGWSPFQFREKRLPTTEELTRAAANVPVYVLYLYSQGYLNARAVEVRGLSPETQAPPGTRYEFMPDGGCILHAEPNPDLLYQSVGVLPAMSAEEQALSSRHFYRELNRFGLTSVIDAGGGGHRFPEDYAGSDRLAETDRLPIRISKYLFPQNKGQELEEFQRWTRDWQVGVDRAHELMNAYVLRGGGEFLAWAAGDYENFLAPRPDIRQRPGWRRQLIEVTRHLLRNRWPLRIHATYDESTNLILDVFEEAHALEVGERRLGFAGIRWAFDHGETLRPSTLKRIRALGGGMAMQARMAYAGEYFLERYGEEATRSAPPLRDVILHGLPLGLGSDATRVASYNPWNTLYWATTGKSVGGTELHGEKQRLTRAEALFHHTVGSAWFSQEEVLKGRLKLGQFADFTVLNAPYFEVDDEDLRHVESDLTVVGGRVVYGAEEFSGLMDVLPPIQPSWSPVRKFGGFQ